MISTSGFRYIACLALVGGLGLGEVSIAEADTDALALCQRALISVEQEESDIPTRLKRMRSLGEKCRGTGLYEYHLGKAYINNREYEKSAPAFDDGLELDTEFSNLLLLGKGDIYLHQNDYPQAERVYREVTDRFPEWYAGFNFLGFALLAQDKNSEAIESLVKSNALAEDAETYKHLTIAYYRTGQHEQAIDAFNRAYSLDESVLEDSITAADGIKSYAMIGKFEIAQNILALMLKANPDVKQDPKFLEAGYFLKDKMKEAGLLQ